MDHPWITLAVSQAYLTASVSSSLLQEYLLFLPLPTGAVSSSSASSRLRCCSQVCFQVDAVTRDFGTH